jgi:hypothetical protein
MVAALQPSKRGMQRVTHCTMIGIMDNPCHDYPKITPCRDLPSHLLGDGSDLHLKPDVDTIGTKRSRRATTPRCGSDWLIAAACRIEFRVEVGTFT